MGNFIKRIIYITSLYLVFASEAHASVFISSGISNYYVELNLVLALLAVLTWYVYSAHMKMIAMRVRNEKLLESLKEQQEIFDLLMEYSPIYIFFKDEKIRAIKLSKNYVNLLGMPAEEALGKTMDDLFPSDFAKKMIRDDINIMNGDVPVKLIEEFNGRTYITLKFPIKRRNGQKFMAGFTIDITDQKKTENDLMIAKQQAEAANEAKDIFLANMSHELRTPMNGIIGFTSLMETSGLNEKQLEYNEMIRESADHLLELINDILDFSKLKANKLKLERAPFDIVKTVRNAANMIIQLTEKKGLKFSLNIKSNIGYKVMGDRLRVKQILINLLSNAVKFTPSGSVSLSLEEKGNDGSVSQMTFVVSDTGIGIPSDRFGEIFEMFSQIDDSASRKYGGAGLGLSIVKGLCEAMDGKVSVESDVNGGGSVFTVEIPFEINKSGDVENRPARSGQAGAAKPSVFGRNLKLLLVEDDVINQKFMKALIMRMDWTVQTACNGREAVAMYEPGRFDAIIMDGQMPEMNGFEAASAIREIETKAGSGRVPIIALTAYAMKGDREKFLAAGMDDYLAKPVQNEEAIVNILKKYITD